MQFWLLKSEPDTWSFEDQKKVAIEPWNGVRNYQARNNLRTMKEGDLAFFYHSNKQKAVVGMVEVVGEHYPDIDEKFSCVDVKFYKELKKAVTLEEIKNNIKLQEIALLKQSRLSVMPIAREEFLEILKMGETKVANLD